MHGWRIIFVWVVVLLGSLLSLVFAADGSA